MAFQCGLLVLSFEKNVSADAKIDCKKVKHPERDLRVEALDWS